MVGLFVLGCLSSYWFLFLMHFHCVFALFLERLTVPLTLLSVMCYSSGPVVLLLLSSLSLFDPFIFDTFPFFYIFHSFFLLCFYFRFVFCYLPCLFSMFSFLSVFFCFVFFLPSVCLFFVFFILSSSSLQFLLFTFVECFFPLLWFVVFLLILLFPVLFVICLLLSCPSVFVLYLDLFVYCLVVQLIVLRGICLFNVVLHLPISFY